ncbi:hypothetical protein O1611_g6626 [Lasiodiplodia mahajangana]|uniref:Uncharacterized protein n=1 Tax=Lasiodiplodia mahajangana TaxID=1108764 RepID=A0ACC2JHM3_9PEZI|nr:hypothetical protein O1611_g6626 [Lasiodiplodia mahajangana]
MDIPTTPKRQGQSAKPNQQLTPPSSAGEETTAIIDHSSHGPSLPIRCHAIDTDIALEAGEEHKIRRQTIPPPQLQKQEFEDKSLDLQQNRDEIEEDENEKAGVTQESERTTHQRDTYDRPEGAVQRWIYSATSEEQRRKRSAAVRHSTYPSNDVFNAARHPFYDPEEDGEYDDFIKYDMWDGPCPWDDDDYDPRTDPSRSTEVWQPKIGDEGIENEEDLRMVLRARKEDKDRARRFEELKIVFMKSQRDAGVDYADMDMTQVLVGPDIVYEYSDSDDDSDGDSSSSSSSFDSEVVEDPKLAVKEEATSVIANSRVVKIKVVGAQDTGSPRRRRLGRPRGSKDKKKRVSSKRKRGPKKENPNSTYHYDADSEDETPARKKGRKAGWAGNEPWRAQTRSATRNVTTGMDGSYDEDPNEDSESSIVSSSENDWSSESSDNTAESLAKSHATEKNEDNGSGEKRSLLSRFASFITG